MAKKANTPPLDFETALMQLEQLVQTMERGELTLDASLQEYERGVQLIRVCQTALSVAEQRVKVLNANQTISDLPPMGEE